MEKTESYKIKSGLLNRIRELKRKDDRTITWHIERGLLNYLKAKETKVK